MSGKQYMRSWHLRHLIRPRPFIPDAPPPPLEERGHIHSYRLIDPDLDSWEQKAVCTKCGHRTTIEF